MKVEEQRLTFLEGQRCMESLGGQECVTPSTHVSPLG